VGTTAEIVNDAKSKIHEISPQEVSRQLDEVIILDVREADEYAAGHIPGAINIPRGLLEFKIDKHPSLNNREAKIVLQCQGGGRSALATVTLQKLGYKHVSNLAGGLNAWSAAGLPTEK
jgi:rhodanese-related sulfurtransferase